MAKVLYARLCRKIRRDKQTGSYSLRGSFTALPLTNAPVSFVLVVNWQGANETFQQSFAILDADGNLLDQTPATECVLNDRQVNISTAFFYTVFPQAGHYNINVYKNGACIETIPLRIMATQQTDETRPAPFAPLRSAETG